MKLKTLNLIFYTFFLICLMSNLILNHARGIITVAVGGAIGIYCAKKCYKWAEEIRSNVNCAYLIGFFFGLSGLLCYWIYYKIRIKKK